jgi:NTP pyrophosphatase (non-canonical NTP hydrolase)
MSEQFNGLTPAEAERLFYLLEELGEAQQAIGKTLRHGYESRDPTKAVQVTDDSRYGTVGWLNTSPTNREMLASELGDVMRAIEMLRAAGDVDGAGILAVVAKGAPMKYMHHQSNG